MLSDTTSTDSSMSVAQLKQQLDTGAPLTVIDVRNPLTFAMSKIEGADNLTVLNAPFSEIMAEGGADDFVIALRTYAERHWADTVPTDVPVVVVCASGVSSVPVTGALRAIGYDALNLTGGMAAWGNFYDVHTVFVDDNTTIFQISRPARGCLSYMIAAGDEAVVIDPLRHETAYIDIAQQHDVRIVRVLDTHGHADHISGGPALARALDVPYNLHPYDAIHPIDVLPAVIDYEPIHDGQQFSFGPDAGGSVGAATLRALHVPGHTLGSVALILNESHAFVGDTVFVASIARPDLGGRGETWAPIHYESLQKLMELPAATVLWPGHHSSLAEADVDGLFGRTVTQLRDTNAGVQQLQHGRDAFVQYILANLPKFPQQYIDIKRVNIGLLTPSEREASTLELGRNICALSEAYDQ